MITSLDELIAALGAAQSIPFRKAGRTGIAFGVSSLWGAAGVPGPGASPADVNGSFPTHMTPGALRFLEALGAEVTQIARAAVTCSAPAQIVIYDRIWHGKVNVASTAKQPIVWPSIGQRYADGVGVELFAEIETTLGSTAAATWTAEIMDQDGVGLQQAKIAYGTSGNAGRMIPFDMPADALGVRRVQSIQLSASQPSGALNLVLARRLVEIGISSAGVGVVAMGADLGLPRLAPGACLAMMVIHGNSASSGDIFGRLEVVQS